MALIEKTCSLPSCGKLFKSSKSLYCCKDCRKAGAWLQRKSTNLQKFGVENPFQSQEIKDKIKTILVSKYGVDNPMKADVFNDKAHKTMLEKYGHSHALQAPAILDKMKTTMLERHGAPASLQSGQIRNSIHETMKAKYGNSYFSISHIDPDKYELLNNKEWLIEQNETKSIADIQEFLGVKQTVVNRKFREFGIIPTKFNSSKLEKEIIAFLQSIDVNFISHDRTLLGGKELDIVIPDFNLAIECNGTYWHSELNGKDKNYHLSKTILCNNIGISLIHVWEHEWIYKSDIIKSMLMARLGKNPTIYARNCKIKLLDTREEKEFLIKNHLQGYCASSLAVGLYDKDVLVSLMSFGNNRFTSGFELLRFCNLNNKTVIGAASKLFKHVINIHGITHVISYSHKDKFTGDLYKKLGFTLKHISSPAYYYTKNYDLVENRIKYQKHKLKKILPIFDENLSEWENMQANGYDRIWDCGNDVWEFKKETV